MDSTQVFRTVPYEEKAAINEQLIKAKEVASGFDTPFGWHWGNPYFVKLKNMTGDPFDKGEIQVVDVTVEYEPICLSGWHLVAVLDHTLDPEANMVYKADTTIEVPINYRKGEECVHCGTRRNRHKTILVHNQKEGFKQVGTSCVKDYLGHSLGSLVSWFKWIEIIDDFGVDEGWALTGGYTLHVPHKTFLQLVAGAIRSYGWVSRSKSWDTGIPSTATIAWYCVNPKTDYEKEERRKLLKACNDEDGEIAQATMDYVLTEMGAKQYLSDYEHNLVTAMNAETVTYKTAGIVASAVPSYHRHIQATIEKENKPESNHIGQIKKRETLKLQHLATFSWMSQYGRTYLNKFQDEDGNIVVWKTGAYDFTDEQGNWFEGKCTVKAHDVYRGEKQTIVTRCKLEQVDG